MNVLLPGYQKNFEKETLETVDSLNVGYDYGSVMHYGEFFFTREKGLRTLEPTQTTTATIGQRIGLSDLDVQQGNLLYNCPGMAVLLLQLASEILLAKQETSVVLLNFRCSFNLLLKTYVYNKNRRKLQGDKRIHAWI